MITLSLIVIILFILYASYIALCVEVLADIIGFLAVVFAVYYIGKGIVKLFKKNK